MTLTQITEKGIKDGEIINADINASAAIAKSKIENLINNNADNRVITGSGTTNTLNGEADLTFDGNDLTINKTGGDSDVIIKTTTSGNPTLKFNASGAGGHEIGFDRGNTALTFTTTGSSERMRIDSAGRLLVGTNTNTFTGVGSSRLQVSGTGADTAGINLIRTSNDGGAAFLQFTKNRGGATQSGDGCGAISFMGHDGTDVESYLALIQVIASATATSNSMTGDIVFETANGSSVTSERMRIASDGFVTFSGDNDTGIKRTAGNTLQIHTNNTLCTEFSANQRVRMPQVYSTNGSNMRDVQIESDGTLCAGNTSITAAKINITDITDASWIYNLKPKTFNFRKKTVDTVTGINTYLDEAENGIQYGFLAEDFEKVNKDYCYYNKDSEGKDVLSGINYNKIVVPLLKAVQDLKAENTALTTRVAALEAAK